MQFFMKRAKSSKTPEMHSHTVSNYYNFKRKFYASPSSKWHNMCCAVHFMQFSRKPCSITPIFPKDFFSNKIRSVYLKTSSQNPHHKHAGKIRCTTTYVQGMFHNFPKKYGNINITLDIHPYGALLWMPWDNLNKIECVSALSPVCYRLKSIIEENLLSLRSRLWKKMKRKSTKLSWELDLYLFVVLLSTCSVFP